MIHGRSQQSKATVRELSDREDSPTADNVGLEDAAEEHADEGDTEGPPNMAKPANRNRNNRGSRQGSSRKRNKPRHK